MSLTEQPVSSNPSAKVALLVVSAWSPELERFRELSSNGAVPGDAIETGAVGIGLVDAAIGTTQCVTRHSPAQAVFLGTAGAVPGAGLAIGDVVVARAHRLVDGAVLEDRGAMPFAPEGPDPDPFFLERFTAAGARPVVVATSPSVTTDDALAARLAGHHGCEVEHLEAFAFARACAAHGVPATVVLGIANMVGSGGRAAWREHHVEASARAGELLARVLALLAAAPVKTKTRAPSRE